MKKIAILTSGGDAPGMNAAIRAAVRYALSAGLSVYGINRGYAGLIEGDIFHLDKKSVSNIIHRGGTFLQTDRCPEFLDPECRRAGANILKRRGIEGLIVLGGDGTFHGAQSLANEAGIKVQCIPCTIDRDLGYTEYTIGFDTAVNNVLWAINSLRDTMQSHNRVAIVEVMGRNCGDIALAAGLTGGAEFIIVPEVPFDVKAICDTLHEVSYLGKKTNMIVVAEGAIKATELAAKIKETGISAKTTVLGHIQRGGSPTYQDRMLACRMAIHAVNSFIEGNYNRAIGISGDKIFDMDIDEALAIKKNFDTELLSAAHKLS